MLVTLRDQRVYNYTFLYATPCICWQQYSVVKIVRKENKQMNRRQ